MKIFGLDIVRRKKTLSSPSGWGSWWPIIREPFGGAWQRNLECSTEDALSFSTVWSCISLISGDISKLDVNLIRRVQDDIWVIAENTAHSPLLNEPNHFQTTPQFFETWVLSKLIHGNTYALKYRDERNVVTRLYILDAMRVKPLVADNGQVFYQLSTDNLSGLASDATAVVPASEIIHDRMTPLYHPLIGVSPIRACALTAMQGLKIQRTSDTFFENGAQPGGILTTAGVIGLEQAAEIQKQWQDGFAGPNRGKVAVLGADLKYQQLTIDPVDAQLVEQLKLTGEIICSCFHVPAHMVGVGPAPPYNNVEALQIAYYSQCLHVLIKNIEELFVAGLQLPSDLRVEFDEDSLWRMDTATLVKAASDSIGSGGMSPNEARKRFFGLGPVAGGDGPYLQQQNYSLAALAKRDASDDPFQNDTTRRISTPDLTPAETPKNSERSLTDMVLAKSMQEGLVHASAA